MSEAEIPLWDALVMNHPLATASAMSGARPMWETNGWTMRPIGLWSRGALAAGALLVTKRIPHAPWTLGRLMAMLVSPDDVAGTATALVAGVEAAARSARAIEVEVQCKIPRGVSVGGLDCYDPVKEVLVRSGYAPGAEATTYFRSIDMDDDTLLASFSGKARRDARKGLREGVTVRWGAGHELFDVFREAHSRMSGRKGLGSVREDQYAAFRQMCQRELMKVFAVEHGGHVCNLALIEAVGTPCYALGATTEAALEKGRPPTGQVLHLEIMKWFRDRGRQWYDLGGTPGPEPLEGHPNYTVWRFKHEFGVRFVSFLPAYRRAFGPVGRYATGLARRVGWLPG